MMRPRPQRRSTPARRRLAARLPRHPAPRPAARPVPLPRPAATAPRYLPKPARRGRWPGSRSASPTPPPGPRRRSPPTSAPSPTPGDPAPGRPAGADRGGGDARLRADDARRQLARRASGWRRGRSGSGVGKGVQTLYAASRSATGSSPSPAERARVLTWGFTLLGNASSVEPAAYFGLTHTELVWMRRPLEDRRDARRASARRRSWRRAGGRSAATT